MRDGPKGGKRGVSDLVWGEVGREFCSRKEAWASSMTKAPPASATRFKCTDNRRSYETRRKDWDR